jgi:hypothetical protein
MINRKGGKSSYYIIRSSYNYIIYQYDYYGEILFSVFPPPDEISLKDFNILSAYNCIALFKIKKKTE